MGLITRSIHGPAQNCKLLHAYRGSYQRRFERAREYQADMQAEGSSEIQLDERLNFLVQQGFYVPVSLFYQLLRRSLARRNPYAGQAIHDLVFRSGYASNRFLANHIICMYACHGKLQEASQVFTEMVVPDVYIWSSIILAHAEHGQPKEAILLYWKMRQSMVMPDNHTFVAVLKACICTADLTSSRHVHADVLMSGTKPDVYLGSCLVDMYGKCGSLDDARRVFDSLTTKDVVIWTTMLAGYTQHGLGQEALALYASMEQEGIIVADRVTFICLLKACADVGASHHGKRIHARVQEEGLDADVVVGSCLVDMYAKCGSLSDARSVFDSMATKNVVTWNAMLSGYAEGGLGQEAISLYVSMQQEGNAAPVDNVTFVCLLRACASVGAFHAGKEIHSHILERGLDADAVLGSSLVDMYSKCGSLDDAHRAFQSLTEKNVVTWTAMIAAYGQHGLGEEAQLCYEEMRLAGVKPNEVTILALLSACSHAGLVDKGFGLFYAMSSEYGMAPGLEHYGTMIDLLGRAGCFSGIERLLSTMPMQPNLSTWLCVLSSCRKHGNVVLGEFAFDCAVCLRPNHPSAYTLMLHIYSDAGLVDQAKKVERLKDAQCFRKEPGRSWIEHEWGSEIFVIGDCNDSQREPLHRLLKQLAKVISRLNVAEQHVGEAKGGL